MCGLYYEELLSYICALSNSKQRLGYLIVAKSYQNYTITEGFSNIKQCFMRLQNMADYVLKLIDFNQNIRMKIEALPFSNPNDNFSNQYLIKIEVSAKKDNTFYYGVHQLGTFRPIFLFYELKKLGNGFYQKQRLSGQQIYKTLQQSKRKRINYQANQIQQLQQPQAKQITVDMKNCPIYTQFYDTNKYIFNTDPSKIFEAACQIFEHQNFQLDFPQFVIDQNAFIVEITQTKRVQQILKNIQEIFQASKIRYRIFFPMMGFQNSIENYYQKQGINSKISRLFYFIFEGKNGHFKQTFTKRSQNNKNKNYVKILDINNQLNSATLITDQQLMLLNTLLFNKFVCLPKIAKQLAACDMQNKIYKQVQFIFSDQDLNVRIYLHYLLYFTRKRPY